MLQGVEVGIVDKPGEEVLKVSARGFQGQHAQCVAVEVDVSRPTTASKYSRPAA
jgi:hypothetical protein